jgi:hypothetical protein
MRTISISLTLASAALLAFAGCSSSSTSTTTPSAAQYQQIERLSRPAIKEVFEAFANHDTTNRSAPTNDTELQNSITTFLGAPGSGGVANRSAAISAVIVSILIPDEMKADLSQTVAGCGPANAPCGAYLGVETGGATGSKFGGRWLNDDTVKTSLGIIFGNTVPALGLAPDDGNESWCLSDQNLSSGEGTFQSYSNTFPYVNSPY